MSLKIIFVSLLSWTLCGQTLTEKYLPDLKAGKKYLFVSGKHFTQAPYGEGFRLNISAKTSSMTYFLNIEGSTEPLKEHGEVSDSLINYLIQLEKKYETNEKEIQIRPSYWHISIDVVTRRMKYIETKVIRCSDDEFENLVKAIQPKLYAELKGTWKK